VISLSTGSAGVFERMASGMLAAKMDKSRSPFDENFTIGIIGLGDMGKMYARRLSDAGWR
jgi:phosphoglycerate dehydrogenase-like enzyme